MASTQTTAPAPARCEAHAQRGTGTGTCDEPLDSLGQCPRARAHIEPSFIPGFGFVDHDTPA